MAEKDEFQRRLDEAKKHRREQVEYDAREIYKFCFNGRESEWDNKPRKGSDEPEETFSDICATVAEDFFGELFHTMTPENTPWVEYEAGVGIPEDDAQGVQADIEGFEAVMDRSVRTSNYYDEGMSAFQDAVIGNVALWIDRPGLSINVEAVPLSEVYLRVGPYGLDDRFRRRRYAAMDIPALLPGADFSKKLERKITKQPSSKCEVVWGFWQDWSDPGNPVWVSQVRVDSEAVGLDERLSEPGEMPFVIGRYNPQPQSAWGRGPGRRMLPTMRVLDEISRMNIEQMDRNLDPAIVYPHDGFLDLSDGIEPGLGYPALPGSAESIKELGVRDMGPGFFTEERMEEILRDGFYREIEQRGKTPPSASQYVGQEQKQLRRMARPAGKLWRELGIGMLARFEYLERNGGMLEGFEDPMIDDQRVIVRPISPLERAQAREDVLVAQSIMGMAAEALGEQAGLLIDGPATMNNVKAKLKDKIVEFRTEEQIQALVAPPEPAAGQGDVPTGNAAG